VVMSALAAGCSASTPVLETEQTVQPAPLVTVAAATVPQSTVPSTTVFKPAPTAGSTAVPVTSFPAKSEDQLKIEFVVSEYRHAYYAEIVNKTFDLTPLRKFAISPQIDTVGKTFQARRIGTTFDKWGSLQQVVTTALTFDGTRANAFTCERNDIQVWEGKGTASPDDDLLIDGKLGTVRHRYGLERRGEQWLIFEVEDLGELERCSGQF
jgi:hypothetical protein